jgi:hypothetical protein
MSYMGRIGDERFKKMSLGAKPISCGLASSHQLSIAIKPRFDTIYNHVYNTEELNIAWLSVLGSLCGNSVDGWA